MNFVVSIYVLYLFLFLFYFFYERLGQVFTWICLTLSPAFFVCGIYLFTKCPSAPKKLSQIEEKALTELPILCIVSGVIQLFSVFFWRSMNKVMLNEPCDQDTYGSSMTLRSNLENQIADIHVPVYSPSATTKDETRSCNICLTRIKTVLLLPCRHLCLCRECAAGDKVTSCPICRNHIDEKIIAYM